MLFNSVCNWIRDHCEYGHSQCIGYIGGERHEIKYIHSEDFRHFMVQQNAIFFRAEISLWSVRCLFVFFKLSRIACWGRSWNLRYGNFIHFDFRVFKPHRYTSIEHRNLRCALQFGLVLLVTARATHLSLSAVALTTNASHQNCGREAAEHGDLSECKFGVLDFASMQILCIKR